MTIEVIGLLQDEGSIVLFDTSEGHVLAVDHRCAQDIVDALERGEEVEVEAESWQLM